MAPEVITHPTLEKRFDPNANEYVYDVLAEFHRKLSKRARSDAQATLQLRAPGGEWTTEKVIAGRDASWSITGGNVVFNARWQSRAQENRPPTTAVEFRYEVEGQPFEGFLFLRV